MRFLVFAVILDLGPIFIHTSAQPVTECEEGWKHFNFTCYKISRRGATFEENKLNCEKVGAQMVSIYTAGVDSFIFENLPTDRVFYTVPNRIFPVAGEERFEGPFWLSARRTSTGNNNFTWASGLNMLYSNWSSGEPRSHGDCVAQQKGKWKIYTCDTRAFEMCQKLSFSGKLQDVSEKLSKGFASIHKRLDQILPIWDPVMQASTNKDRSGDGVYLLNQTLDEEPERSRSVNLEDAPGSNPTCTNITQKHADQVHNLVQVSAALKKQLEYLVDDFVQKLRNVSGSK